MYQWVYTRLLPTVVPFLGLNFTSSSRCFISFHCHAKCFILQLWTPQIGLFCSYPVSLLYPFQDSDNMGRAVLLAFDQGSLWAAVVAHIHLRDEGPAIPGSGTEKVREIIMNATPPQIEHFFKVLLSWSRFLHLKERDPLWRESQGGVQKLAGWQVHVQICLREIHRSSSVQGSAHHFS